MTIGAVPGRSAVRPLAALGPCRVAACTRRAESEHGYCPTHYVRWRAAVTADPGTDQGAGTWPAGGLRGRAGQPARACRRWWWSQVLFGIQQRARGGAKITDVNLRAVCDTLRRQQSADHAGSDRGGCRAKRPVAAARAGPPCPPGAGRPGREQAATLWDLAVFGHPGRLSFTGITQPWLRQAAKAWAAEDLPRHRGGGAGNVREKISALARLSESLRARDDHGNIPASAGPPDIDGFLSRLGYLESAGTISRYRRNVICRGARAVLAGIRALGLTRPGQAAAGLPGDFTIGLRDIPADRCAASRAGTSRRRSWPCCAPAWTPWSRPRSGPRSRSPSTPGGAPKTSSACRWTAWTATGTARRCSSTTTPRRTGSAGACRSARQPPQ